MVERTYPEHGDVPLDPKVFTHPVTGSPHPILVKSATGGMPADPTFVASIDIVQAPTFARTTTAGHIPAGAVQISVTNVGSADGIVVTSGTLKPTESVTFTTTDRHAVLPDFYYDATGTEFIVTTLRKAVNETSYSW